MTFGYSSRFAKHLRRLPDHVQRRAFKALEVLELDPRYPSLHFKEVSKRSGLWSARVSQEYRLLGYRDDDHIEWFWVGPHDQYDKLIARSQ